MSGPAGVSDGYLGNESLVNVEGRGRNLLAETSNLSDLLEVYNGARGITIDTETSRVVPAVLLAGKPITEGLEDFLASL